jgi:BMFP domain-containing protein YqiC
MNRREKLEKAIADQRSKGNMILIPRDKLKAMQEKIKDLEEKLNGKHTRSI